MAPIIGSQGSSRLRISWSSEVAASCPGGRVCPRCA